MMSTHFRSATPGNDSHIPYHIAPLMAKVQSLLKTKPENETLYKLCLSTLEKLHFLVKHRCTYVLYFWKMTNFSFWTRALSIFALSLKVLLLAEFWKQGLEKTSLKILYSKAYEVCQTDLNLFFQEFSFKKWLCFDQTS